MVCFINEIVAASAGYGTTNVMRCQARCYSRNHTDFHPIRDVLYPWGFFSFQNTKWCCCFIFRNSLVCIQFSIWNLDFDRCLTTFRDLMWSWSNNVFYPPCVFFQDFLTKEWLLAKESPSPFNLRQLWCLSWHSLATCCIHRCWERSQTLKRAPRGLGDVA